MLIYKKNKCCLETSLSLPNLEEQFGWIPANINFMGGLDFLCGFDMLKVREGDTTYFCISTPWGVYRMLAAPMGFLNTPAIFMDRIIAYVLEADNLERNLFGKDDWGALLWLDDLFPIFQNF